MYSIGINAVAFCIIRTSNLLSVGRKFARQKKDSWPHPRALPLPFSASKSTSFLSCAQASVGIACSSARVLEHFGTCPIFCLYHHVLAEKGCCIMCLGESILRKLLRNANAPTDAPER